jgi:predicted RNA-binding Zn-ribbon protein involved in translation (DUF1610 family)
MPKRTRDPFICPRCGTRVEPSKTWQLVSPFPDSKGRITITVMGSFVCPECGHKWRGVVSKLKVGGEEVELETGSGRKAKLGAEKKEEKREGVIFEIDIDEDEE